MKRLLALLSCAILSSCQILLAAELHNNATLTGTTVINGTLTLPGGTSITASTGTGSIVLSTSPTLVTPTLGAATATSINGLTVTSSTGTLTIANGKTFAVNNTLTLSGTDGAAYSFPGGVMTGTIVIADAPETLSAKTLSNSTIDLTTSGNTVTMTMPETAAVSRAIKDILHDFPVSVKDFGAAGDGVTDDTTAVKAAYATGVSIYWPRGIYLINDVIPIRAVGQRTLGAGVNKAVIRQTTSGKGVFVLLDPSGDGVVEAQWIGLYSGGSGIYYNEIAGLTLETSHAGTGVAILGGHVFMTCSTNSTTTVTCTGGTSTTGMAVGQTVTGTNIPANDTVASITDSTHFVLAVAATGTGSGLALEAGGQHAGDWPFLHDLFIYHFHIGVCFDSFASVRMARVGVFNGDSLGAADGIGVDFIAGADPNQCVLDGVGAFGCVVGINLNLTGFNANLGEVDSCTTAVQINGSGVVSGGHYETDTRYFSIGSASPSDVTLNNVDLLTDTASTISPILVNHSSVVVGSLVTAGLHAGTPLTELTTENDRANLVNVMNASDQGATAPELAQYVSDAWGKKVRFPTIDDLQQNTSIPTPSAAFLGKLFRVINGNGIGDGRMIYEYETSTGSYAWDDLGNHFLYQTAGTFISQQTFGNGGSLGGGIVIQNYLGGGDTDTRGALVLEAYRGDVGENVADLNIRHHDYNTGEQNFIVSNRDGSVVNRVLAIGHGSAAGAGYVRFEQGLNFARTITSSGTDGAQTINKPAGSVNFAAAATSLVVTDSLVKADSIITATVATHDATLTSVQVVAGSGSFTLYGNAAATAETRVNFIVTN